VYSGVNVFHVVWQLELEVKTMLDTITADSEQKQQLLQGEVIDKAEQLSQQYQQLYIIVITSSTNTRKIRTVQRSSEATAQIIMFCFITMLILIYCVMELPLMSLYVIIRGTMKYYQIA